MQFHLILDTIGKHFYARLNFFWSFSGTVIGAVIMEGYYIIFDRANKSIGFAETTCHIQNVQTIKSKIQGPFISKGKYTYSSNFL